MTAPWQTNETAQPETADLRDYIRPIWRHKVLILVLVAVATVGTYLYYDRQPRTYQSGTTIFIGEPSSLSTSATPADQDRVLANQARLLLTAQTAVKVAKDIGFRGDPRALLNGVSVAPVKGSDFVDVSATTSNPQVAAALANAFAQAFIEVRSSDARKQTEKTLAALQKRYDEATGPGSRSFKKGLLGRINQLQVELSTPAGSARQIDRAVPASVPIAPQPKRNAIFAFALSLLLGIIAAFGIERIDRRIKSSDEAGRVYGLPVIATVRTERDIAPRANGRVGVAEGVHETFRSLRSNLDVLYGAQAARTILVTSAVPAEGKSTVLRNLALVYAEAGFRVAVLEADVRRPTLAALFLVQEEPGLTNVLMGTKTLGDVMQEVPTQSHSARVRTGAPAQQEHGGHGGVAILPATNGGGVEDPEGGRLDVITSGPRPADPPAMFSAPALHDLVKQLGDHYDIVLIDSPPLLAVSDAVPLTGVVDGTLLVARLGTTTVDAAERSLDLLKRLPGARVLGLVVNGVDDGAGGLYGGY